MPRKMVARPHPRQERDPRSGYSRNAVPANCDYNGIRAARSRAERQIQGEEYFHVPPLIDTYVRDLHRWLSACTGHGRPGREHENSEGDEHNCQLLH
jgi:hypothetical protein